MERTITLTSEEVAVITLAIQDKINNTRISSKVSGISLSENTERRLHNMVELTKKLNEWKEERKRLRR